MPGSGPACGEPARLAAAAAALDAIARRPERPGPHGLELATELLERLGRPQDRVPAVHVAGTRGKGSTCALLAAALHASGLRVGLTTSPHLVDVTERIRLDERDVSREALLHLVADVLEAAGELQPSYFETLVAASFLAFDRAAVDLAVIEVGLGGRLDATNTCAPVVTAITRLGLEHCDRLGPRLSDVAREKAGILKKGVPAVVGPNRAAAVLTVERVARDVGAPLHRVGPEEVAAAPETPLRGRGQRENAAVAWRVLQVLQGLPAGARVRLDPARRGLAEVRWPGRLQRVPGTPELLLDVSHDPEAVRQLVDHLGAGPPAPAFVFTCLADKDLDRLAELLAASPSLTGATAHVPSLALPRARPAREVVRTLAARGVRAVEADGVAEALEAARADARRLGAPGPVPVFGSFAVVGRALDVLRRERETAAPGDGRG